MSQVTSQELGNSTTSTDNEITLKDLIQRLFDFVKEIWKLKWWVLAAIIVVASLSLVQTLLKPRVIPAAMTFMVNDESGGGGAGGVASLLGQFGFGGANSGEFNLDKILELSRSMRIINTALFKKVTVRGKEDFIANHIIINYEYQTKNWKKDTTGLRDFLFKHDTLANFSRLENKALKNIYDHVKGTKTMPALLNMGYTEETGILNMTIMGNSEQLSIGLLNSIYKELSEYYISRTVERQQRTFEVMKNKTDSLGTLLNRLDYEIARFSDTNFGLLDQTSSTPRDRLLRERGLIQYAYAEAVKNKELSEFTLRNITPVFQVIDAPMPPLGPIRYSKSKALILGGFLGGFLAVSFIILRKIYREAMQ
ncbi:MAG: hypothetical protein HC892_11910 [Saprospiraceae bacterium]|nr:hypothetical protein [Saprospiraceae bacterium]